MNMVIKLFTMFAVSLLTRDKPQAAALMHGRSEQTLLW